MAAQDFAKMGMMLQCDIPEGKTWCDCFFSSISSKLIEGCIHCKRDFLGTDELPLCSSEKALKAKGY